MLYVQAVTMSFKLNKINDIQFLTDKLPKANYKFAKTMANMPHSYTLKTTWSNQEDFFLCVELIRTHGYQEEFLGKTYTYFDIGDYKYWTMGASVKETILINRAERGRYKSKDR